MFRCCFISNFALSNGEISVKPNKKYCIMRNLINKHTVLSLVLFSLAWNAFGQETSWEKEYLVGKVKTYEMYAYEFDISDSINHEDFMKRFYQCDFDVDRMIRFADSIMTEIDRNRKGIYVHEYDSLGYLVKILLSSGIEEEIKFQNEYDNQSRVLRRIRAIGDVPQDSVFFTYDDLGRLKEERHWSHVTGFRTMQWIYDSEGRLLEENRVEGDSVYSYFRKKYDKKGILRKSERFGFPRGDSKIYCEYDSKGNVIFERTEYGSRDIVKAKTKYKYDKNDSIVKETCRKTRWYKMPKYKDEVWQEIDSAGHLIDYSNYIVEYNEYKTKSKSVRTISRDEKGTPIEEIYEVFDKKDSEPCLVKTRYDELGRVVEETRINSPYSGCFKKVFRYYEDSERLTYYATYNGDDEESAAFSHESLFFFDEHGNCIAHIQWMPETQNFEYYFEVYRCEYYE